jgi:L,D-transpeptidase ErfK/SrfK
MNLWRHGIVLFSLAFSTAAVAEVYELPPAGNDVVGALTTIQTRDEETLLEIARRHGLGYEEIVAANPDVDTWLPGEGTDVVLPTRFVLPPGRRSGIILNLAEYRMYYFPQAKDGETAIVMTFPMSIGRMDWETPLGRTAVVSKVRNPSWYPPESIRAEHAAEGDPLPRIVPAGPQNPLGEYAMRLGIPGYLIHGTNRPAGVGMRVTHGCIRMFPEDIGFFFGQVPLNTPVRIINEPVKVGWDGDELVVEVHETLAFGPEPGEEPFEAPAEEAGTNMVVDKADDAAPEVEDVLAETPPVRDAMTALTEQFVLATSSRRAELDWDVAEMLLERADGIPVTAGRAIKDAATSAASE